MQSGAEYSPGECLVSVNAQVMAWDDKFSGWVPFDGGGISTVSLCQRLVQPSPPVLEMEQPIQALHPQGLEAGALALEAVHAPMVRCEYYIFGQRIDDKKVLLNCILTKDVNYRQVMPTFHHWQIEEDKFGLKFMSSYEACKFHNKLQKAVEHLARQSKSSSGESNVEAGDLEDEVFVPVDLPLSRESSETSANRLTTAGPSGTLKPPTISVTHFPTPSEVQVVVRPSSSAGYPYVEFQKHPLIPPPPPSVPLYGSTSEIGTPAIQRQPSSSRHPLGGFPSAPSLPAIEIASPTPVLPASGKHRASVSSGRSAGLQPLIQPGRILKKPGSSAGSTSEILRREQCFYCKQYYYVRDNIRGSCPEAPDACDIWIQRLTCLWCADCLVYCCCREEDGDVAGTRRRRRWTTVALLALVLPCLWCYPPLAACHKCCRQCGWIAGRHKPISGSSPEYSRSEHSSSYK